MFSSIKSGTTDYRVRRSLEYAGLNIHREISLAELAAVNNISISHLCRIFRDNMGISPLRSIKLIRLATAANLLVATPLSVKQVMGSVGISDASHFVKDFKAVHGASPVQYRKQAAEQRD